MHKTMTGAVLGLAVVLGGSALADTVNVEVYGTLLPFLDSAKTWGATATAPANAPNQVAPAGYTAVNSSARGRLTSGTSNIGFRGNVVLVGDWKAIFQVEAAVPVDGDQAPLGVFASRNSHVGVSSPFGTLFYGIWDTPYKWTTITIAPVRGLNPFDYDDILENPGFNVPGTTTQTGRVAGKADAAFSRRQGNSIQYWTPTFYGLSARAGYSLNEGKAAIPGGGGRETNPDVLSLSVAYETGLFFVRYAYEQHDDYFGMSQIGGSPGASATNPSSKDKAHKVVAALLLPQTRVFGTVERLIYDTDDTAAGAVNHYRRDAYYLQIVQRFGPAGVWGGFGQAFDGECERVGGAACSTNGLGAVMWSIGGLYDFGRRTTIYASYFSVITGDSSSYGIFPAVGTTAPGANSRGLGLGILQIF